MTCRCPACGAGLDLVASQVAAPAAPGKPRWLQIAEGELGQAEVAGDVDNPRIVEYHAATSLRATDDETPWCASFVSWCLERAGIPSTRSAASSSYRGWGRALLQPEPGCLVVFDHGGGKGHVGFWVGGAGDPIDGPLDVLGGNQSNQVKVSRFDRQQLHSFRWPQDSTR